MCVLIHGDDYLAVGCKSDLCWLRGILTKRFEMETTLVGHDSDIDSEVVNESKILNRVIRATSKGWQSEADPRHAELLIEQMELEKAHSVATPGVEKTSVDSPTLDMKRTSQFRVMAARANYLSLDRSDIQFAVKELCRDMSSPSEESWVGLKRLCKYLKGHPRVVYEYKWQDKVGVIDVYSDANWAACKTSRKSISGGAIQVGTHTQLERIPRHSPQ